MSTPFWRSGAVEQPEESVALRGAVLGTVLIAVIAVIAEGLVGPAAILASLVGIPAGFWWSHRRRHHESAALKLGIAVALTFALTGFIRQLRSAQLVSALDVQIPLAELFLWVQFLHSLHLPSRRDLMFSLAASLVMLAVAGVLSVGMSVGIFILLWTVAALVSLHLAYRSRLLPARIDEADDSRLVLRGLSRPGAAVAVCAVIAFLVAPAAAPIAPISFPAELAILSRLTEPGGFSNPALGGSGDGDDGFSLRASFGYFGFAESLDTSLRGRPDDSPVMQVRAPAPAFWRGQTFDVWDGRTWTSSSTEPVPITGAGAIPSFPTLGDDRTGIPGSDRFIQTFYVERPGPNLIFGAYRIDEVYFTERTLFELDDGTLRTGVDLGAGSIYTVASWKIPVDEDLLRSSDPLTRDYTEEIRTRYLQLPDVPQRVLDLAREVTAGTSTTYDKVRALEAWMSENTRYSLDIPPLPAGADAVDQFLFVDRRGFCEQIGSSLVVMLRSIGIPSRLVVGYTPGERNPFTGLYEVKASDAHSWAEVYFPGVGWQGFDPTASVPLYGGGATGPAGRGLLTYLTSRLGELPAGLGIVLRVVGAIVAAVVIVMPARSWIAGRRSRRRRTWGETTLTAFENIGSRRGILRAPSDTPLEYLETLETAGVRGAAEAGVLVTEAVYGFRPMGRDDEDRVLRVLEAHRR